MSEPEAPPKQTRKTTEHRSNEGKAKKLGRRRTRLDPNSTLLLVDMRDDEDEKASERLCIANFPSGLLVSPRHPLHPP